MRISDWSSDVCSSDLHEVNQPLSAIATNAETSLRWLSRDEPNLEKIGQLTARVAASAHHASEIVQRIRGTAAKHMPDRISLDLNDIRSEEHTSELQSLMRISYAVFCLKKQKNTH